MNEIPLFPKDVMALLGITTSDTLRKYIKAQKVPAPDVVVTRKQRYWWRSTLERAGLIQKEG